MTARCTGAIPTLGYPTRYEAAAALQAKGFTVRQIAAMTGTSMNAVEQALTYHRHGRRKRYSMRIYIPKATLEAFEAAAQKRGVKPADLARRILAIVAKEGLADAILDDRSPA